MIGTIHLVGSIITTSLYATLNQAGIRSKEQLWITPTIGAVDISQQVWLEECKIDTLDFTKIHIGRLGEFVTIVPLP